MHRRRDGMVRVGASTGPAPRDSRLRRSLSVDSGVGPSHHGRRGDREKVGDARRDVYEVQPLNDPQGILQLAPGPDVKGKVVAEATLRVIRHPRIVVGLVVVKALVEYRLVDAVLVGPVRRPGPGRLDADPAGACRRAALLAPDGSVVAGQCVRVNAQPEQRL